MVQIEKENNGLKMTTLTYIEVLLKIVASV